MSTSFGWEVNRRITQCTSPMSVVAQFKLVSGWGLRKRRSVLPGEAMLLGKDYTFLFAGLVWSKAPRWYKRHMASRELHQQKIGVCQTDLQSDITTLSQTSLSAGPHKHSLLRPRVTAWLKSGSDRWAAFTLDPWCTADANMLTCLACTGHMQWRRSFVHTLWVVSHYLCQQVEVIWQRPLNPHLIVGGSGDRQRHRSSICNRSFKIRQNLWILKNS